MRKPSKATRIIATASFIASTSLVSFSASANPCVGQQAGCVLPVEAPAATAPVVVEEESGGLGWLIPALLGAAAIVGLILILDDDDDDEDDLPVSV